MIDYVKFYVQNVDVESLTSNPVLDFRSQISKSTGEIGLRSTANYHHCTITVHEIGDETTGETIRTHVIFSGSLHKLWNSINGILAPNYGAKKPYKGFNGNDFTLKDFLNVRQHLTELLCCQPQDLIFEVIEFGINNIVDFLPILFIKGLLHHHNIRFDFEYQGRSAQALHQRFIIKIYDKGHQYGLTQNVLRIELKYLRMLDINGLGIYTAADITADTLRDLKTLLLKKFNEVLYFDYTVIESGLTKTQRRKLSAYANANFWLDLEPSKRDRPKKDLDSIIRNHSRNLRKVLNDAIHEKCAIINQPPKAEKCVIFNNEGILVNITQKAPTRCLVTGLDISMQKDGSLLLSHTGLKFYQRSWPSVFASLKQRFLTSTWYGSDNQKQIEEIAHNIRTVRKNAQRSQRRLYNNVQYRMFELQPANRYIR